MREFTKSMVSFSWSMSLFGVQQMANLFARQDPNRPRHKVTESFDCVTRATEDQLDDALKETFKAGDKFQRGMMDMVFGVLTLRAMNPSRMMNMGQDGMMSDGCCGQGWSDGGNAADQANMGWGPMPASGDAAK